MATTTASMPKPAVVSAWRQLGVFLREELKPTPGRMRAALTRVAGVLLAMWLGYALNLPEVSAAIALAFFASTVDRDQGKKIALGVPMAVFVIYLVLTVVLNILGLTPFVRVSAFIVIVFTSLYLLQAAQEGQVFLLAGIFGKLFLELWDSGYPASLTHELSLWIVADLAFAGICAIVVSSLFGQPGKDPGKDFCAGLAGRFELLARILAASGHGAKGDAERLRAEAFSALDQQTASLDAAVKKNAALKSDRTRLANLVRINQLLLHECVALQIEPDEVWQQSSEALKWAGSRCRAIAQMVRTGSLLAAPSGPPPLRADTLLARLVDTILLAEEIAAGRASLPEEPAEKKRFFRSDAFTNPTYLRNASRAFAAAFACYCLVSGAKWSGIGTAITTCLITSLTTVEQSRQKQSLRIAGASAGAILTLVVMVFVLPSGVGLIGLSIASALVTFAAAWIFAGGPNLNYAGVQLGICYFLSVFGENKTPTSLTTVRDRVIGIFIGNLAMWLFYDRIHPAWTVDDSRCAFADEVESIARLVNAQDIQQDLERGMQTIAREREAFAKAHAALKVMSDTGSPAFSPWAKAQQSDAPEIRYAELQFNCLFSLEYVEAASVVLHLPVLRQPDANGGLARSLFALASKLRDGKRIEIGDSTANQKQPSSAKALLEGAQSALTRLFGAGKSSYT